MKTEQFSIAFFSLHYIARLNYQLGLLLAMPWYCCAPSSSSNSPSNYEPLVVHQLNEADLMKMSFLPYSPCLHSEETLVALS